MTTERNRRKVRQGVVVSAAGDKTCVVQGRGAQEAPAVRQDDHAVSKKFHAHDEDNECGVGDTVADHGDAPAVEAEALASRRDRREGQVTTRPCTCAPSDTARTAHGRFVLPEEADDPGRDTAQGRRQLGCTRGAVHQGARRPEAPLRARGRRHRLHRQGGDPERRRQEGRRRAGRSSCAPRRRSVAPTAATSSSTTTPRSSSTPRATRAARASSARSRASCATASYMKIVSLAPEVL